MNMKKEIKITADFPCLIKVNETQKHLQTISDFFVFEAIDETEIFITCYPTISTYQNQKLLPYTSKLNLINPNQSDIERLDITIFNKNNISTKLKPFLIMDKNTLKTIHKNFQINNQTFSATLQIGKVCTFSISFEDQIYFHTLDCLQQDFSIKTMGNFVFAEFLSTTPTLVLVFNFSDNFFIVDNISASIVEYEKNKIQIYSDCNDIAKHGKITTYHLEGESVTREVDFVYANKKPQLIKKEELIPYAFFEALKIENFNLARFYLCEELNEKLTNDHLKLYFKKYVNVIPAPNNNFKENRVCLVYEKDNIKECKMFDCRIENSKIKNIFAVE